MGIRKTLFVLLSVTLFLIPLPYAYVHLLEFCDSTPPNGGSLCKYVEKFDSRVSPVLEHVQANEYYIKASETFANGYTTTCSKLSKYLPNSDGVAAKVPGVRDVVSRVKSTSVSVYKTSLPVFAKLGDYFVQGWSYFTSNVVPAINKYAVKAQHKTKVVAVHAWNKFYHVWTETVWPFIVDKSIVVSGKIRDSFVYLWSRVENSDAYQTVFRDQVEKIYETMEKKIAEESKSTATEVVTSLNSVLPSVSSVVTALTLSSTSLSYSSTLDPTSSSTATPSSTSSISSSTSSSSSSSSSSSTSSSSIPASGSPVYESQDTIEAEQEPGTVFITSQITITQSASSVKTSVSPSATIYTMDMDRTPKFQKIQNRVKENVKSAFANLDSDADAFCKDSISTARPEIMQLLRDLQSFGEKAVRNLTIVAERLESDDKASQKIDRDSIYPVHEKFVSKLGDYALAVRDRSEQLASDVLEGLTSVRQVTVDALDDYFEIVLIESSHDLAAEDDWTQIKQHRQLKEFMKKSRSEIENHEFDMSVVNNALKESQSAAMLLAEEYHQQLANLRARCQLVLQSRDKNAEEGARADAEADKKLKDQKKKMRHPKAQRNEKQEEKSDDAAKEVIPESEHKEESDDSSENVGETVSGDSADTTEHEHKEDTEDSHVKSEDIVHTEAEQNVNSEESDVKVEAVVDIELKDSSETIEIKEEIIIKTHPNTPDSTSSTILSNGGLETSLPVIDSENQEEFVIQTHANDPIDVVDAIKQGEQEHFVVQTQPNDPVPVEEQIRSAEATVTSVQAESPTSVLEDVKSDSKESSGDIQPSKGEVEVPFEETVNVPGEEEVVWESYEIKV